MSEYFVKFVKLSFFVAFVCTTWLLGGEVLYHTGLGITVLYTASFIFALILAVSIWIDMNGR